MSTTHKKLFTVALGLVTALEGTSALAQSCLSKPAKTIAPFAAGGPADNDARFVGKGLQDALGQSFAVENRPGAGSVIGTDAVAKSAVTFSSLRDMTAQAKAKLGKINHSSSGTGTA